MIKGKRKNLITGFDNYQITENGEVFLLNYYYPEFDVFGNATKRVDRAGYYTVSLYDGSKAYTKYLHRLIAETFLPNPLNKRFINHKDGNKLNNSLDNLEFCTHSENIQHAYNTGLIKRKGKTVIDSITGQQFKNVREAANAYGLKYTTLKNYLNIKRHNPTSLKYA